MPGPVRLFLYLFVASILVNAVLGIWALLVGDFGTTQEKVLGSSFLLSAAMLSVLVNVPAIRRRPLWPAPLVGAIAGAFGFVLFIGLLWTEPDADGWDKLAGSSLVVAAAATLACGLALIPTPDRFRRMRPVGNVLIALLGVSIVIAIWAEADTDWYARLVGVQGVLVAAMTLLIPVLSRFAGPDQQPAREAAEPGASPGVRFCPSCGSPVTPGPLGSGMSTTCAGCGLTFEVKASPGIATVKR